MTRIAGVGSALPSYVYPQSQITALLAQMLTDDPAKREVIARVHSATQVRSRCLVQPIENYLGEVTFTESNDQFVRLAADLAAAAVQDALDRAGVSAHDVDCLVFTTVTGASAPSVDALLIERLGFRQDVKRLPLFGLGCVAGAAGIARLADYLAGHPDDLALLVAVEVCSLTIQRDDESMANIVASGLFGDGAGAVVMVGENVTVEGAETDIRVMDASSRLYPDSRDVLGFYPGSSGFRIELTPGVIDVIQDRVGRDAHQFLGDRGLNPRDVDVWIAHPGGPKVLDAFSRVLDLPEAALQASWSSLARVGNLSSASVLHILADEIRSGRFGPDRRGLLFALGPGVSAEFVLLAGAAVEEG